MSMDKDQNESGLPTSNVFKRETVNLLPRYYRTNSNKKFLQATLDQLVQPGTVKKINGYIGKRNSKASKSTDIFLEAPTDNRKNYQLEPAAIIRDYLGNTTFFKDYIDHINHISTNNGIANEHNRLNKQEFYSWNPHICWDKFVNFQQYYWLPFGPDSIRISGQQRNIESTYTVKLVDEEDNLAYVLTPNGLTRNPTITLYRGQTYSFEISSKNNPFSIKTSKTPGNLDRYNFGIDENAIEEGTLVFQVPLNAPDILFYVNELNIETGGVIQVLDVDQNTFLNVEQDILGKKYYKISSGEDEIEFSNGMKLQFSGNTFPEIYSKGFWYVEGVGTAITLIPENELEVRTSSSEEQRLLFDDFAFDQLPFSEVSSLLSNKDYVLINRASKDRNPWSRFNRWFHQDVIVKSAKFNNRIPELNQDSRAVRPIIEFNAGIKLFNYGINRVQPVDLIDNFTLDAFSEVEGSLGYNIDGVDLADGMTVIFNADTDKLVQSKVFTVNFIDIQSPGKELEFDDNTQVDTFLNRIKFSVEHGFVSGNQVIYLSNVQGPISGLVNRQQYFVNVIDRFTIELHSNKELSRIVLLAASNFGIHKLQFFAGKRRQIQLIESYSPKIYDSVFIRFGIQELLSNNIKGNQSQNYWFNGTSWVLSQAKLSLNQSPLFDLFDKNKISLSDEIVYEGSTFKGNKLFSYKQGQGQVDKELGIPLSYLNIDNIGDIVFEFDLLSKEFSFKENNRIKTIKTNTSFLQINNEFSTEYENGWITSTVTNTQPVIRIFKGTELVNRFQIDVFENSALLDDLVVQVYINSRKLKKDEFYFGILGNKKIVILSKDIEESDIVTLKCYSAAPKNNNGYYELPISLKHNPLNEDVITFTLGQVTDHVNSIVDNLVEFQGVFPGLNNIRDLGNISNFGTKFVQHSCPLVLPLYYLGNKDVNLVKALSKSREDYATFKRSFIIAATESGIDTDSRQHVDYVLQILANNATKSNSYYLSDMFGLGASNKIQYTVLDSRIKKYPLSKRFTLTELSNKAVNIYLNGIQLLEGRDYVFSNDQFFEVKTSISENDIIEAFEYDSTDGTMCPPTPTKLGIYPKFEPKKFIDTTYLEPIEVIQGHDGSITVAFGDYRDDLILELEKRIFNNIKVQYNSSIFDIYDYIPGYNRKTEYSREEFNTVLSTYFFQWTVNINQDYSKHTVYDRLNPFTFNYRGTTSPLGDPVPSSWRGIYQWYFDTISPHQTPWECLGFSIKPDWWDSVYGPAPYTKDNLVLWEDLLEGIIKEPNKPLVKNKKVARPVLQYGIPVDENGNLIDPLTAGLVSGTISAGNDGFFVFGDSYFVESAWRRSSNFPFALLETLLILSPCDIIAKTLDRSRIFRNLNNQLTYTDTDTRLTTVNLVIPTTTNSTDSRQYTSGLINYIIDYITSESSYKIEQHKIDLKTISCSLTSRIGSFTSKDKYKILLDSKNPKSSGGIFIPEENYNIEFNVSSPIEKIQYSGVIITKFSDGYEIKGYSYTNPYFTYFPVLLSGSTIKIGGISESFINWAPNRNYTAGKIVRYSNQYFRVKTNHRSEDTFDQDLYARLKELPIIGGREATLGKAWDKSRPEILPYGTKLTSIQAVVDFLQGYSAYLENLGFIFDEFNPNTKLVSNWETSVKEFLFWTTQNWAEGSVLALSPAANRLLFESNLSVVDNLLDSFNGYQVFRVDGEKIDPDSISVFRSNNRFILESDSTNVGIYGVTLYLVQKEHIVVFDDKTLFNDIIFDKPAGYSQSRMSVIGYITSEWNGGFEIPGFVYDDVKILEWEPWKDYNTTDVVKYKEFFYSAKNKISGSEEFDFNQWQLLREKPISRLLPNLDYKAEQFTDFYDLDSDNFDVSQQEASQHLIGYQKRQYLENIIKNDTSQYKFYQGMITEKGTQNSLSKLFDVLSSNEQESLSFDEEWAIRVGEYGAIDTFEEIEFILDEKEFKISPQPLQLVDSDNTNSTDFVYRQRLNDVYIKPRDLVTNLWKPYTKSSYLRNPGFVRKQDVDYVIKTLSELESQIELISENQYIWTSFEGSVSGRTWDVYKTINISIPVESVTYNSTTSILTIEFENPINTEFSNIIIQGTENINGLYKVVNTDHTTNVVNISAKLSNFTEFEEQNSVKILALKSVRIDSVDNINSVLDYTLQPNDLIWVDDNGQGKKTVFSNGSAYTKNQLFQQNRFIKSINFSNSSDFIEEIKRVNNTAIVKFKIPHLLVTGDIISIEVQPANGFNAENVSIKVLDLTSFSYVNSGDDTDSITELSVKLSVNIGIFGTKLSLSDDGNTCAISDNRGFTLYIKGSNQNTWSSINRFNFENITNLIISSDSNRVAAIVDEKIQFFIKTLRGEYEFTSTLPLVDVSDNFGKDLKFVKNGNRYYLIANDYTYGNRQGRITVYSEIPNSLQWVLYGEIIGQDNEELGFAFDSTLGLSTLFVSTANQTRVKIYNHLLILQGDELAIPSSFIQCSSSGDMLVTGDLTTVNVYKAQNYTDPIQSISKSNIRSVLLSNDGKTLILETTNNITSTFDVYNKYYKKFIYGESFSEDSRVSVSLSENVFLVSTDNSVVSYFKLKNTYSWKPVQEEQDNADVSKIKSAFLYNKLTNKLITYLDVVDVNQGKIPGIADQEIRYKTYFDPAIYSVFPNKTAQELSDSGVNWTTNQVGMLWWDLSTARFYDSEIGEIVYKSSTWNKLYDSASIDIYEWVESSVLPEEWNKLADTEQGLAKGISGTTKYNNSVYSISRKYDSISQSFKNTYYFWVKNKATLPRKDVGRKLEAVNVANLIKDPAGYGYPCIAFLGTSAINLINIKPYLEADHVVLAIQYWTSDVTSSNAHSHWKLISTNTNTKIPKYIEEKWFDSLVGRDLQNRIVPDPALPLKQKYGVENNPRQSMFVNRIEALKQFIDNTNSVLKTTLVVDEYDISDFLKSDPVPSKVSEKWDIEIETDQELKFVNTLAYKSAILRPTLVDGKIVGASILDTGFGYGKFGIYNEEETLFFGPPIIIKGIGQGAKLKSIVDTFGRVQGVEIINQGQYYSSNTELNIRPFSVLVKNDLSSSSSWAIYAWDIVSKQWYRTSTQSYNVQNFWSYIDWYAADFSEYTFINYLFENTYEMVTADIPINSVIKVNNIGTGGWVLFKKVSNKVTIDYTENFNIVGRQNGTIQISENIYNANAGYDVFLHDSSFYDNFPVIETRIILTALRDKIFVDKLKTEYLKLFFASLRFILSEQTLVDWMFKTSFVKARHNLGSLKQKPTYNSDNLESFEDYLNEVKPYRTKIREYISNYNSTENSSTLVSDFDLLPIIDSSYKITPVSVSIIDNAVVSKFDELKTYPWKSWLDNLGYTITSISIDDQGHGYITPPVLKVSGDQLENAESAKLKPYIANGKLNRIEIINPGTKWISAPKIEVLGGLDVGGTPAKVSATIGNSVVRSPYITIKFDRINQRFEISDLIASETFEGQQVSGSQKQFNLKWSPDTTAKSASVTINDIDILPGEYVLKSIKDSENLKFYGQLIFNNAPPKNSSVKIHYTKNFNHLSATDRIHYYYNPTIGQAGNSLDQLMSGVDYAGVSVTGVGFGIPAGWDSGTWATDLWDQFDEEFADFTVTLTTENVNSLSFKLPYVPKEGEEITIYYTKNIVGLLYNPSIRIDDPNFLTELQLNSNAIMPTFIGNGEVDIINIPAVLNLSVDDRIIFRKKTSDGSLVVNEEDIDTVISGGVLSYATGFSPDDINLDGDDFVTPSNSHAPEEVIPGQVLDTLSIKVYEKQSSGSSQIKFISYIGNGVDTDFAITQYFPNKDSVIVKVDDEIKLIDIDYIIDVENNLIKFVDSPQDQSRITIVSLGFNSSKLLDLNYFVANGDQTNFITGANWALNIYSIVLVNGSVLPYEIFQTSNSKVGIRFAEPIKKGSLINYIITEDNLETTSIVKTEIVNIQPSILTYDLQNIIGINEPYSPNVLVKNSQKILSPASSEYFTMKDFVLKYNISDYRYNLSNITPDKLQVYVNSSLLLPNKDYIVKFNYQNVTYTSIASTASVIGGTGYQVDDILEAVDGEVDIFGNPITIRVVSVNQTGEITDFRIINEGNYVNPINTPILLSGGSGNNAQFITEFRLVDKPNRVSVELSPDAYKEGQILTVVVNTDADYIINSSNQLVLLSNLENTNTLEVISFYNHNILGIERTVDRLNPNIKLVEGSSEYFRLTKVLGGKVSLRNAAVSGDYVWIIKNGNLLMNNIDYSLDTDRTTVNLSEYLTLGDTLDVISFTASSVRNSFGYMQFKDIFNRTHYKRLNANKSTKLVSPLLPFDSQIVVENANVLDDPDIQNNVPGIIEINGERIEYFIKFNNILKQIRRGTLGTSIPNVHQVDALVQNIGKSETISYKDAYVIKTEKSNGSPTQEIKLDFLANLFDENLSSSIEVYLGGTRLKKSKTSVYYNTEYPYSPDGDVDIDEEFYFKNSFTIKLNLRYDPTEGTKILIIKKQGHHWGNSSSTESSIWNFIKSVPTNLPN